MSDDKVARAYRHYDTAKLVLQLVAVILLIGLAGWQLYQESRAEEQRANSRQVLSLLAECTTPPEARRPVPKDVDRTAPGLQVSPSDCYARSNARTASAIGQLSDISVIAAACGAANPGDVPATRRCVEEALR